MMNPLESPWFFRMVKSEARTPAEQLLAVFQVTEKWIAAPGIRETLADSYMQDSMVMLPCARLREFLSDLASSAGAEKPEVLANHLVILLQGAIAEELRNPELQAMAEAAKAARAVIAQARPHGRRFALLSAGGVAATVLATFMGWHLLTPPSQEPVTGTVVMPPTHTLLLPTGISPSDMESVLALHEQFERGVCPAPHLLVLPPGQMTAYMNAIHFRTPDNPAADRENLKAFMAWFKKTQSTECYFAPQNGHTTVAWTQG